jgi:hypothetical protein
MRFQVSATTTSSLGLHDVVFLCLPFFLPVKACDFVVFLQLDWIPRRQPHARNGCSASATWLPATDGLGQSM